MVEEGREFWGWADLETTLSRPLGCRVALNKSSSSSGSQSYSSVQWGHSAPPVGNGRLWLVLQPNGYHIPIHWGTEGTF